jgi:hypothetical protein
MIKKRKIIISLMLAMLIIAVPLATMVQAQPLIKYDKKDIKEPTIKRFGLVIMLVGYDFAITNIEADQVDNSHPDQSIYYGNVIIEGTIGPDSLGYSVSFLFMIIASWLQKRGIDPFFLPGYNEFEQGDFRVEADQASVSVVQEVEDPDNPDNPAYMQFIAAIKAEVIQ